MLTIEVLKQLYLFWIKYNFLHLVLFISLIIFISCDGNKNQDTDNTVLNLESEIEKLVNFKSSGYERTYEDMLTSKNISKFGDSAVPKLLELVKDTNKFVKYRAIRTLELYDSLSEKYLDEMGKCLNLGELTLSHYISKIGSDEAINILVNALKKFPNESTTLTYSFKKLGAKCLPSLINLILHADENEDELLFTSAKIFEILGEDAVSAVKTLDSIANSKNNSIKSRKFSIISLGKIGPEAKSADSSIFLILKNEKSKFLNEVTNALIDMRSPLAAELVENRIIHKSSKYSIDKSFRDLSLLGSGAHKTGPTVLKFLTSDDWNLRVNAALTLGLFKYKSAIPELIRLLSYNSDWRLNYASLISLKMMNARESIPEIKKIKTNHWYGLVRRAAKEALNDLTNVIEVPQNIDKDYINNIFFEYGMLGLGIPNCKFIDDELQKKMKIWNGTLIGSDNGEWGGFLQFIDSKGRIKDLLDDNIKSILIFDEVVIVVTGLIHLDQNSGLIYQVNNEGNEMTVRKVIVLPGAPIRIKRINENELMIATYGGTVILSKDLKLRHVIC